MYATTTNNPSAITVSGLTGARHRYQPADVYAAAPYNAGDVSGTPAGAAAGVLGGPTTLTTLSLASRHMTSSLSIHSHFDTSCLMLVNYGVVHHANPVRDGEQTKGS